MPRDINGNYTLPSGNPVVSGTVITADEWANPTLGDVAAALTGSLARNGEGGMTAPLKLTAGSAAAPGLAFTDSTNTGLYLDGSAAVFVVGGVAVWRAEEIASTEFLSVVSDFLVANAKGITFANAAGTPAAKAFSLLATASNTLRLARRDDADSAFTQVFQVRDSDEPSLEVSESVVQQANKPLYFAQDVTNETADGTYRLNSDGAVFFIQVRDGGSWVTLMSFTETAVTFNVPIAGASFTTLTVGTLTATAKIVMPNAELGDGLFIGLSSSLADALDGLLFSGGFPAGANPGLDNYRIANVADKLVVQSGSGADTWVDLLSFDNISAPACGQNPTLPAHLTRKDYVDGLFVQGSNANGSYAYFGGGATRVLVQWGVYPAPAGNNANLTVPFPLPFDDGELPTTQLTLTNVGNNATAGTAVINYGSLSGEYINVVIQSRSRAATGGSVAPRPGTWFAIGRYVP